MVEQGARCPVETGPGASGTARTATGERRRPVGTQAARRQLMRSVTAEIPEPPSRADRAARREALLHALEMSRRRRGTARRP